MQAFANPDLSSQNDLDGGLAHYPLLIEGQRDQCHHGYYSRQYPNQQYDRSHNIEQRVAGTEKAVILRKLNIQFYRCEEHTDFNAEEM